MATTVKKSSGKPSTNKSVVKQLLVTQPRPETEKSPYFELEKKYGAVITFQPLIQLEGIPGKEFRKQKIDITQYTAVIFTSRNAIEHFFRTCEELKLQVSQDMKYFCVTEAIALFLQKYILYRKRKVFFGADGANKSMLDVINKHKEAEKFLYVCSENQQDSEITNWLKANKCKYQLAFMYRTVSTNVADLLASTTFDCMCFFTPSGIKSLLDNAPNFQQGETRFAVMGNSTQKACEDAGFTVHYKVPSPQVPSMSAALDGFLNGK
ncbi:MAG: uroporphyrinogen-III synthase [Bacteroidetes bacterium]|jgi:uroporphyrinogen-III synthase|nr:MAG: uroporphyrinogen-III synthase [Bacteroidota bacterium]TAE63471.1 MAG: uroporphyrinogen-III synthase [Bacteroidota bacterium]TAF91949.1 MAG: uroporphyrinogen-III synthase [Bacteroidota bacterium]